jgi:hypothetical protein
MSVVLLGNYIKQGVSDEKVQKRETAEIKRRAVLSSGEKGG